MIETKLKQFTRHHSPCSCCCLFLTVISLPRSSCTISLTPFSLRTNPIRESLKIYVETPLKIKFMTWGIYRGCVVQGLDVSELAVIYFEIFWQIGIKFGEFTYKKLSIFAVQCIRQVRIFLLG